MNLKFVNKMFRYTIAMMVVGFFVVLSGCGDDGEPAPTKTIYELVSENEELSILKGQLDAAGMEATLSGAGTFTLFAPSNAAMTTLLKTLFGNTATDPALFAQISPAIIQAVLSYHLSATQFLSKDLTAGLEITTLQTEKITIAETTTGEKKLDTGASSDAAITTADIKATNGVIHIIDIVIVPPTIGAQILQMLGKVAQTIFLGKDFTTLAAAIQKADQGKDAAATITAVLVGGSAITVFAIPNAVFEGAGLTVASKSGAEWDAIIRGHIIPTETLSPLTNTTKTSLSGKTLTITGPGTGSLGSVQGTANSSPVPVAAAAITNNNGVTYPIGGIVLHIP